MNMIRTFINAILLMICIPMYAQLVPDWSTFLVLEGPFGLKDSVEIGLSTNATNFYDLGYDLLDTTSLDSDFDIRIFNSDVAFNVNECYNLRSSYEKFPSLDDIEGIAPNGSAYSTVEFNLIVSFADLYPLDPTHITYSHLDFFDYQFLNSEGWRISNISFEVQNLYIGGVDGLIASDGFGLEPIPSPNSFVIFNSDLIETQPFIECSEEYKSILVRLTLTNDFYTTVAELDNFFIEGISSNEIIFNRKIENVELYDLQGRFIVSDAEETNRINCESLESGLYIVRIRYNENSYTFKYRKT